ncbi:MAG: HDOD domain-containing protein [Proteobacteria bacterium]|nr:HDOD domain-containing protein [Pseudomonadota bacterium]MDE3208594.1 HDOD domain-containing protein [Pseudomonadota bacterium]
MSINPAYLIRKAIIDSNLNVRGYFLSFGEGGGQLTKLCSLFPSEEAWPFRHLIFLLNTSELDGPVTCKVPPETCAIVLNCGENQTIGNLDLYREQGFEIAMAGASVQDFDSAVMLPVDCFLINIDEHSADELKQIGKECARSNRELYASGICSREQFSFARHAGFSRFVSSHFLEPVYQPNKPLTTAHAQVIELLDLLRKDADDFALEEIFKRDVALSFKILRYINSAGFGLMCEIESIRHAIQVLGRKPLYRWLILLLATAGSTSCPALMKTAVIRGRFVELLGAHLLDKRELDTLFIAGVFSLLDVILERPMEEALDCLLLPESINEALLNQAGVFTPFIELAIACERTDPAYIHHNALLLGLSDEIINHAHIQALAWVEELDI